MEAGQDTRFWADKTYTIKELAETGQLPKMVRVNEGIYGATEAETFSQGDLLMLHKIITINKVVACFIDGTSTGFKREPKIDNYGYMEREEILVPLGYKGKLNIFSPDVGHKVYNSVGQLILDLPRFVKVIESVRTINGELIGRNTVIELDRFLPSQGLICKWNDKAVCLNKNTKAQFLLMPDKTEYTLAEVVDRFPFPQFVTFVDDDFPLLVTQSLQEAVENVISFESQALKLLCLKSHQLIIGHHRQAESVFLEGKGRKDEGDSKRTVVIIPMDSETATDIEVDIPLDEEDEDYELMQAMNFRKTSVDEETFDGTIYVEVAKHPKIFMYDEIPPDINDVFEEYEKKMDKTVRRKCPAPPPVEVGKQSEKPPPLPARPTRQREPPPPPDINDVFEEYEKKMDKTVRPKCPAPPPVEESVSKGTAPPPVPIGKQSEKPPPLPARPTRQREPPPLPARKSSTSSVSRKTHGSSSSDEGNIPEPVPRNVPVTPTENPFDDQYVYEINEKEEDPTNKRYLNVQPKEQGSKNITDDEKTGIHLDKTSKEFVISKVPQTVRRSLRRVQTELVKFVRRKAREGKGTTTHLSTDSKEDFELPESHIYEDPEQNTRSHTFHTSENSPDDDDDYDYPDVTAMKMLSLQRQKTPSERRPRSHNQLEFESMSFLDLAERFKECHMDKLAITCKKEGLDGSFFMNISDDELLDTFSLNKIDMIKFKKIRDQNWKPR